MNLQRAIATAACALGVALSPMAAQAAPTYSAIYAFGDSLSDAGNLFGYTNGSLPAAPYYQGEFSNGPNWIQDLSAGLGLAPLMPSLAPGGTDYAWGGATTAYAGTASTSVPNLTQQVGLFAQTLTVPAPSSALYTVWIGANDLFGILGGSSCPTTGLLCTAGAAQSEADAIALLASIGARNFLVPLLPDLGLTPGVAANGPLAAAAGTALSKAYNQALLADLAGLAGTSGMNLRFLDTFSLMDSAVADPAAFGLANVTAPCYVGPYTGGGSVCSDPSQYLFWDQVHPTAAGAALVAQAALRALPEPGTLAIVALGLAGLAASRRRRAAPAAASCCA
ncbi:MAG: SGNH/GDSL hydrolase family protein [Burkholderiales bacterium]|nr:SGNH/GDSL hydrolase family protein [Burkholderiales bacterium]MDE2395745.1 SGNH/GDSL hydrolase family protein [Burkholderiales bacterium]MDE2457145.1 SGNH/GDSL hydrolase family protein [Burkholderiales bacterium]